MINRFANWLVPRLADWCERRKRVFRITGTAGPDDVYLIRYFLFRSKYFSIYIHRFLRSDRDDPHDHPFNFLSYIVKGSYLERLYDPMGPEYDYWGDARSVEPVGTLFCPWAADRKQGSWGFRPAETVHSVFLSKEYTYAERDQAPLSVIFRGVDRRQWGFWKEVIGHASVKKWIKWTEYLGVPESGERE